MCVENCEPTATRPPLHFEQPGKCAVTVDVTTLISSQYGSHSICLLANPSVSCPSSGRPPPYPFPGFLPILWQWIASRNSPPQLPVAEEEEEPAQGVKAQANPALTGWKPLYLWLPAFCDLTATTVRYVAICRDLN